jgi:hypothetical protein
MVEVTEVKTKSGTTVYAQGGDRRARDTALDKFLKFYNRDFTIVEQKIIGNIWYNYKTNSGKNLRGQRVAETGTFVGPDAKKFNPTKNKMVDVTFSKETRGNEYTVVHEMIHAKKFMQGIPGNKHNEKKIDFEAMGRVSKNGLKNIETGTYFHPSGNTALAKKKIPNTAKGEIAQKEMIKDRKMLTGSANKSIIGKVAEKKSNKLFKKSFFNKKKF